MATNVFQNTSGDNNFANPLNWSLGHVPQSGDSVSVPSNATPTISNSSTGFLDGLVTNSGTITLAGTANLTDLIIGNSDIVTLSGGGTIQLSDSANNRIYTNAGGTTLDNVNNTIAGAGTIFGNAGLQLINDLAGTIDANAAANQLVISNIGIINNGVMEATSGGAGLQIQNTSVNGTSGGTIEAFAGSHVDLNGATIRGGNLTTVSGGLIEVTTNATLDSTASGAPVHITSGSTLTVNNGTTLTLAAGAGQTAKLDNKGSVLLNGTANLTDLVVGTGGTVMLSGGGTIQLSDTANNRIYTNAAGSVLDNVDNVIQGAGQIFSNAGLPVVNETGGVINANAVNNQMIIRNIAVTNKGLIEATGSGAGLQIQNASIDGTSGGSLKALAGSRVDLNGATIRGGSLTTVSGGLIDVTTNATLDSTAGGAPVHITSGSTLTVNNSTTLTLAAGAGQTAKLDNKGTVLLNGTANLTDLVVGTGGTVMLSGGGTIQLSDSANNRIYTNAAGSVLDNVDNVIQGAGQIFSNAGLAFVNDTSGVINANAVNSQMIIRNIAVTNKGLIEATGSGAGLQIQNGSIDGTSGGTIEALAGSRVDLVNATILGGTLTTLGGLMDVIGNTTLDSSTSGAPVHITYGSVLTVNNGQTLTLAATSGVTATLDNKGTIALSGTANLTDLVVGTGGTVVLSGGGSIALAGTNDRIYSNTSGSVFDNLNNTISGAGQIFSNSDLSLINEAAGTINANTSGLTLNVHDIGLINKGVVEAVSGGILRLQSATVTTVSGGVIKALDGSQIDLATANIVGGTLTTSGTGFFDTVDNGTTLDGSTSAGPIHLTAGSTIDVNNNTELTLVNTSGAAAVIDNKGTIAVNASGNGTYLLVGTGGTVTLSGGGTIALSDSANNDVFSNVAGSVLDNVDNTISGAGQIFSNGDLSITNEGAGVINATGTTSQLLIRNIAITNKGLIEATGAAGLRIASATITEASTSATIKALDGSHVELATAAIVGGTLTSIGTGYFITTDNGTTLDGSTAAAPVHITSGSTIQVANNTELTLVNTSGAAAVIDNKGTIAVNASGNGTYLLVGTGGTVTLSGGGTIALSDSANNDVFSTVAGSVLDNVDNTIAGAGQIYSNGDLSITNEASGTIDANSPNNSLNIHDIAITNSGVFRAENAATLSVGGLTNLSADATHSGGSVLTGGTYDVIDPLINGFGANGTSTIALTQNATPITTLAATVDLAGATSVLTASGVSLQSSLLTIADGGALHLYYGVNSASAQVFVDPNGVAIDGEVTVDGATFSAASIAVDATGSIAGAGLVSTTGGSLVNNGLIDATVGAQASVLEIASGLTGSGTLQLENGSTLQIDAGAGGKIAIGAGATIAFVGGASAMQGATLRLAGSAVDVSTDKALITGFQAQDTIDLSNLAGLTFGSFDGTTLTLNKAGGGTETLTFVGIRAGQTFATASDGASGTLVRLGPAIVNITTAGSTTNQPGQTIVGTTDAVEAGNPVAIYDNGGATPLGSATVKADGSFTISVTLPAQGANSLVAKVTDQAGQTGQSGPVVFTLDTIPPAVTETLVTDSGSNTGDKLTNKDAVTGGGDPNAKVSFKVDGAVQNTTASANGSGTYTYTPTGLGDGVHTIVATETDAAGNVGTASLVFTYDTAAPSVAIGNAGDTVTTPSQSISGTVGVVDAGTTVTLSDNGGAVATATVSGGGTWTTTVALSTGTNVLVATDTDAAGNTGTSNTVTYTYQPGSAPIVTEALLSDTGSSSSDGITRLPAVKGTGAANATVSFTIDGAVQGTTASANGAGAYSYTPTGLGDGVHTIVATEVTTGGTGSATLVFTLDTAAPAVTEGLAADTGASGQDRLTRLDAVTGSGDANATVSFTIDGVVQGPTASASGSGAYTYTPTGLGDGTHTIVASETDLAGNTGSAALVFTYDSTAPAVTEGLASDTGANNHDGLTRIDVVTGSGDANATVSFSIDGVAQPKTASAGGTGAYTYTPTGLGDGVHTIVASETDAAGNTGTASLVFTYDTTAPVVAITSGGGAVTGATQSVTGTVGAPDVGTVVTLLDNGIAAGTATVAGNGTWTTTIALTTGANALVASDTDAAGNTGSSNTVTYTYQPSTAVVTEQLKIDTGTSSTDRITRDPTLTGGGAGNAVVTLSEGATVLGTTTANAAGTWTFKPTLADGYHQVKATEAGVGSATLGFALDTKPPTITERLFNDTGASSTDKNTRDPSLTGTGDSNAVVTLSEGGAVLGTTTANANGNWFFRPVLADGSHKITASEPDVAGNVGTTSFSFFLDTKPPTVTERLFNDTGASSTDKNTRDPSLTGTGDSNAVVTLSEGGAVLGTTTANANGNWFFRPVLADGTHTVTASEPDLAGNVGTTSFSFFLDTKPPTVTERLFNDTGASSTDKNTRDPSLTGAGDSNAVVTLSEGGAVLGTTTANANGNWFFRPVLADGTHTVTASEPDLAGNVGTTSFSFFLDTKPPTVTERLFNDTGWSSTDRNTRDPSLTGTGDSNAVVTLSEGGAVLGTTTANANGNWFFRPVLTDGTHTVTASEPDLAGNVGTTSFGFFLDTKPPTVTERLFNDTGSSSTDRNTRDASLTGTGDSNAVVTLSEGGAVLGTTTANANGNWFFRPVLADGSHKIIASEPDVAGNVGTTSFGFFLDTKPPTVTEALLNDTGSSGNDTLTRDQTLFGTGDAGALVTLTEGTAVLGTTTANANGNWAFKPGLADGVHKITASETDAAGNTGSAALTFTLDTTPPAVTIAAGSGGFVTTATQTLMGTGEANTSLQLIDNGAPLGNPVTVAGNGQWSATVTLPTIGNNLILARDTDAAGNVGSAAVTYNYDHPPVFTSGNGAPAATYVIANGTTPITALTASDVDAGDSVTYALLDGAGHPVTHAGVFSIDPSSGTLALTAPQSDGAYTVTAVASDTHGGQSSQAIKVDVGSGNLLTGDTGDHGITDTFVIPLNAPNIQVQNFRTSDVTSGSNTDPHGVLALPHALFNGATAGESGNAAVSVVASHSAQIGMDTVIKTDQGNFVDLQSVDRTALLNNTANFAFT